MLVLPAQLGRYELTAALGAGAMGEVYRAKDLRLDRDVAIKILPEHFARDPVRRGRFEREAKAIAALSHPNILAIYDYGIEQEILFAVLELLDGETLRGSLRRSVLTWRLLWRWESLSPTVWRQHMPRASFIATSNRRTCFSPRTAE